MEHQNRNTSENHEHLKSLVLAPEPLRAVCNLQDQPAFSSKKNRTVRNLFEPCIYSAKNSHVTLVNGSFVGAFQESI